MSPLTARQTDIVNATIQLISEAGIQRLTMKRIAQQVGVTEPALYRHFDSKMDILLSLLESFKQRRRAIMGGAADHEGPAIDRIFHIFSTFIAHFSAHPTVAALIFSEEIFQDDKRLSAQVFEMMQLNGTIMTALVTEGQAQGDIRSELPAQHITNILMGSFRLTVSRWHLSHHAFDLRTEADALCTTLKTMIRSGSAQS
jgi:AcrR family transcriptional regulator